MNTRAKRNIRRTLTGLVTFYITSGLVLYLIQDLFFFHPKPLPSNYQFQFEQSFTEHNIAIGNRNLNMIQFHSEMPERKGAIIYFHGNMRNIERYASAAPTFTKNGYDVWMIDYAGFGKSSGERTEQNMYEDAARIYSMAVQHFSPDQVIIYGRSIGTGVATWLASQKSCKQLILETPYYSITALANHYAPIFPNSLLLKYKFPTHQYLKNVEAPITIFHGTEDEIIPYKQAKKLSQVKPLQLVTIPKGKHNNLSSFSLFQTTLVHLLKQ